MNKICKVEDCYLAVHKSAGYGYCNKHYLRWRRNGSVAITRAARHGMYGTATHKSWANMRKRCLYPHSNRYQYYGGRGIKICDQWLDSVQGFKNFLKDMGERPAGKTLDRIDNDGNYEPTNCRWATYSEQVRNQGKRGRILV